MPEVKKIKDTKITVIGYLTNHKKKEVFRDNDEALIARFWADELKADGKFVKDITAYDFLTLFATAKLTSAETIVRARRLAQNECEELRGKNWKIRHTEEEEVRDTLGKDNN